MPLIKAGPPWRFTHREWKLLEMGARVPYGRQGNYSMRQLHGCLWVQRVGHGKALWRVCSPRGIRVTVKAGRRT